MKRIFLKVLGGAGVLALIAFGWPGAAGAAPETFNTALPVAKGEFIFREQVVLDQSGDDPSGAERDRTAWSAISVLGYGVNSDLALFGVVPYVDKRLELTEGGARRARGARGLGDVSLFGRYTVFKRNFRGGSFRIAPFGGAGLPTGDDDESDSFGLPPASVQPGSGSWDPFGGIVLTYQTLDYQIDAQASYKANTEANSNGTRLFLVPGLQYLTRRWIVEAAVQVPVVQDLNGTALENDYIARAGFRVNFQATME